jgi:hypothetical protein
MRSMPTRSMLAATAVAVLLGGCSSSSGPCQGTLLGYNCGDCLVPASIAWVCQPKTANSTQQAACEMACGSSADQAALNNNLTCLNKIPALVGTCSITSEATWVTSVGTSFIACFLNDGGQVSSGCIEGFAGSFFDGG